MKALSLFTGAVILFLITILSAEFSFGGIKKPSEPVVKDVFIKDDIGAYSFPVEVVLGNGEIKKGKILLPDEKIVFYRLGNKNQNRVEKISEIKSVKILRWIKKHLKGESYLFYPVKYMIVLKDNSKIYYNGNIKLFNRIVFYRNDDKAKKYKVYSIFYDYWKNDRWEVLNNKNFDYPEKNPNSRSVIEIKFLKRENVFSKFFKTFK